VYRSTIVYSRGVDHEVGATVIRSTTKPGGQALAEGDDEEDDESGLVAGRRQGSGGNGSTRELRDKANTTYSP
jgi:hypothetical protein